MTQEQILALTAAAKSYAAAVAKRDEYTKTLESFQRRLVLREAEVVAAEAALKAVQATLATPVAPAAPAAKSKTA